MKEKRGQQGPKISVEKFGVKMGFKKDPKENTGISPDYVRQKLIVVISHSYECIIIYTLELYYKQYSSMNN